MPHNWEAINMIRPCVIEIKILIYLHIFEACMDLKCPRSLIWIAQKLWPRRSQKLSAAQTSWVSVCVRVRMRTCRVSVRCPTVEMVITKVRSIFRLPNVLLRIVE